MTRARFLRPEAAELGLPETQHVRLDSRQLGDFADPEIELIRDFGVYKRLCGQIFHLETSRLFSIVARVKRFGENFCYCTSKLTVTDARTSRSPGSIGVGARGAALSDIIAKALFMGRTTGASVVSASRTAMICTFKAFAMASAAARALTAASASACARMALSSRRLNEMPVISFAPASFAASITLPVSERSFTVVRTVLLA